MKENRKKADPALLEAVFNLSSDGLMICDKNGVILELNRTAERLNGFGADRMVGRNVRALVKEGHIDRSVTQEVIETRRQVSIIQYVAKSGYNLLVTGTPMFDNKGNLAYVVVNERDITLLDSMKRELEKVKKESDRIREELTDLKLLELRQGNIVAESDAMRQTLQVALKLSRTGVSNILIQGESGTGKGLLAKFIHENSARRKQSFIQINCAALPENLLEAELFGYEKGAFTGAADQGKPGLIELAAGGTLFLDEIGEMPLSVQAKILKYLDDKKLMPVGGTRYKKVDCTLVAATNRNLDRLTRERRFRLDLFHRLNTFTLSIPPLRERPEDILGLVSHLLEEYNRKYRRNGRIGHEAFEKLQAYPFPGNVRELMNIVKKAVVMSEQRSLDGVITASLGEGGGTSGMELQTGKKGFNLQLRIAALEKEILEQAAVKCGTTRQAASLLGVSQPTVVRKFRQHGIALKKDKS
ncbi:MAG: sigma 54-interacting transcriptional regulator [Desulfobacteraceae bacterium]